MKRSMGMLSLLLVMADPGILQAVDLYISPTGSGTAFTSSAPGSIRDVLTHIRTTFGL